mgnify:CR=1 FL=1
MDRNQFTFYESFFAAISRIKNKTARCDAYDAICGFALKGTVPDLEKMADAAAIAFDLIRPVLESANEKSKGGKNSARSREDNRKMSARSREDNRKMSARSREDAAKDIEGEGDIDIENECYPLNPLTANLRKCAEDWIAYREEKGDPLTMVGTKMLAELIQQNATVYGEAAVIGVIRASIASGYKGITWDALRKSEPSKAERQKKASNSMAQMVDDFMREASE